MASLISEYAQSIGVTEADAHTARNIHLSVADCKHLKFILSSMYGPYNDHAAHWNRSLIEYLKTAV